MNKKSEYSIAFRDTVIATTSERFLSFTIDISCVIGGRWWGDTKGLREGLSQDRVGPLNLKDPVLAKRASFLAPAILRVGGTEADRLRYGFDRGLAQGDADDPFVLKRKLWVDICEFTEKIGMGLLFTIGAGPETRNAWGEWDPRDATRLMEYCARKNLRVDAWEFGNEVNAFSFIYGLSRRVSGRRYAKDFARFAALVRELQPRSLAVGPASAIWPVIGEPNPIIPALCKSPAAAELGALSFHYYPQQSSRGRVAVRRARERTMLSSRNLDGLGRRIRRVRKIRDAGAGEGKPIWITETGHALYGGEPGLSDTWISMPWWLDQLALMASEGVDAVFRQSLTGGDYGLLNHQTFAPRPDYHVSFLWKRLIGTAVYERPPVEGKDKKLRAWTMGGKKENAWLIIINLHRRRPARITTDHAIRRTLVLEPDYGEPSDQILLNGILVDTDLEEQWGTKEIKRKYGLARIPQESQSRILELPPLGCAFVELERPPLSHEAAAPIKTDPEVLQTI